MLEGILSGLLLVIAAVVPAMRWTRRQATRSRQQEVQEKAWRKRRGKQERIERRKLAQAERKVWMSDPILSDDTLTLERNDSELFYRARNLRERPLLSGRHPECLPGMR